MLPVKNVKQAIGTDAAITQKMVEKIEEWAKMLKGEAPWVDDAVHSLRLEQGIVREFANVTLNEMTSKVTVDKLDKVYQSAIKDINENLQSGIGLGAVVIKPLGEDKVEYITADNFVPLEFDSRGRLVDVVFVQTKLVKDDDIYYRFERHKVSKAGLEITNKAFHSRIKNELGHEISLESIPEWADLPPFIQYPMWDKPDFGYYRNPIKNDIDGSYNGVSIFDVARDVIKKTDIQFGRLDWEFESGERAVHIDPAALKTDKITGEKRLPKLNKRLYRAVDVQMGDGKELFDIFSPDFRDQSLMNGLEEYERKIEFLVGLAYGDISKPAVIEKTATEIMAAKKRKYNTVTAIQNNLRECLSDLVDALAFYNSLTTAGYEYVCDFKDSILVDEETERAQDKADIAIGAMTLLEYRMKWYHETEEEAATKINEPAEIIP